MRQPLLSLGLACAMALFNAGASAGTLPNVAAHYRLSMQTQAPGAAASAPVDWFFYRSAQELRLIKGDIEEVWMRDSAGQVSFERIFHADQRRVFYTAGELRTLGIVVDWDALASLVARDDEDAWDAERQLPRRLARPSATGTLLMTLEAAHPVAPAGWPQSAARASDYQRLDAADLGDMEYDPFARKAEAMDVRAGWRMAHAH